MVKLKDPLSILALLLVEVTLSCAAGARSLFSFIRCYVVNRQGFTSTSVLGHLGL